MAGEKGEKGERGRVYAAAMVQGLVSCASSGFQLLLGAVSKVAAATRQPRRRNGVQDRVYPHMKIQGLADCEGPGFSRCASSILFV
jgi:hypothetical protein